MDEENPEEFLPPFLFFGAMVGLLISKKILIDPLAGTFWGAFLGISLVLTIQLIYIFGEKMAGDE